ncbi:MAG TPA: heme transporter HemC [Hellea balneolensis]|uniref:Heme exporter protein C n=1 Tax=Hellea balneolensis TaxID=287478 RepID=A0A7C5M110_9PROT|nr:heme transporter HemC [Hellea balneolensis]
MISLLANPLRFQKFARYAAPIFAFLSIICIGAGIWFGLWHSPADQLQGHSARVMYVHVPAAWNSMMAYSIMAVSSLIFFVWRHPLADELAKACALPGAAFTALALFTGAMWGKTSWGTYWQWDGRMTSYLILLFLFIGYMSVRATIENKQQAARIAGLVAMVGSINLPIIKFSVDWWNSLHQTAVVSSPGAPGLPGSMLTPLLLMFFGYSFFFGWYVIRRVQISIIENQKKRKNRQKPTTSIRVETIE